MSTDSGMSDDELAKYVLDDEHLLLEVREKAILHRANRRQAVAAGMDPQDWNIARRLTKSGDTEIFASHIKEIVRIAGILMPELIPEDVIAAVPQVSPEMRLSIDVMKAQKAGFHVGNNGGEAEENPYKQDSPLYAEWHIFWDRGLRVREKSVGSRTRIVKAKRQRPQKEENIPGIEPSRLRSHTRGEEPATAALN